MHLALYVILFSHLTFECEMHHTDNINEGIHCVFHNILYVLNMSSIYYDSCETIIIERLAPCSWRWRRLFRLSLCSIQPTGQLVSRFLKINLCDSVIRKFYSY